MVDVGFQRDAVFLVPLGDILKEALPLFDNLHPLDFQLITLDIAKDDILRDPNRATPCLIFPASFTPSTHLKSSFANISIFDGLPVPFSRIFGKTATRYLKIKD